MLENLNIDFEDIIKTPEYKNLKRYLLNRIQLSKEKTLPLVDDELLLSLCVDKNSDNKAFILITGEKIDDEDYEPIECCGDCNECKLENEVHMFFSDKKKKLLFDSIHMDEDGQDIYIGCQYPATRNGARDALEFLSLSIHDNF